MQQHSGRLPWAVFPVALRVVGVVGICVAALSCLAFHPAPRASAMGLSRVDAGTISSSPSAGPVETTISISGSGWGGSDGTPVSFGYEMPSGCQTVSDAQNGTLSGGSFTGWFRWPAGTPLNTYRLCAMIGNVMAAGGSFTLLSSSPPAVSISPSTLAPGIRATITASNYYPAGTSVNFLWMWGNTVIDNLNSVASDTGGNAVLTFTVPGFSIATGLYSLDASAGGGQPATLFSSTNFTYSAPVVSPSPTPRPSPSASPTMTPTVTATTTTTPVVSPTTKASVTATAPSPTAAASPTAGGSQTPATNSTNSGNNDNTGTGTSPSSSLNNPLLIGGMGLLSGALLLGIIALLLLRRRRNMAQAEAAGMPPAMPGGLASPGQAPPSWVNPQGMPVYGGLPGNSNPLSYPAYNPLSAPDMPAPQPAHMPALPLTPAPVMVGAGVAVGNGNVAEPTVYPVPDAIPPAPVSPQPSAWWTNLSKGDAPPIISIPADPALDVLRRQVQSGLFVLPRPPRDERSQ